LQNEVLIVGTHVLIMHVHQVNCQIEFLKMRIFLKVIWCYLDDQ
jgi:hypothetical protein